MKTKLKLCGDCQKLTILWTSFPPMCQSCARKQASKKAIEKAGEYKQVTLTQTENGKVAKAFKYIRPVSKNRQAALAKYRQARDKYFTEKPVCEFPGCISRKITLHHKRGRLGAFLTDKRYFCSLCQVHHRFVEENPAEAKRIGLSDSRLENGVLLNSHY